MSNQSQWWKGKMGEVISFKGFESQARGLTLRSVQHMRCRILLHRKAWHGMAFLGLFFLAIQTD